jgi:hypothetical protein
MLMLVRYFDADFVPALLVVVGPTASGKSALAIVLAERAGRRNSVCRFANGVPGHGHRHCQTERRRAGARAAPRAGPG